MAIQTHDLNIGKYDFSFDIKNEILSACIGYGRSEGQRKLITGFCDKKGNGYAILLRLVAMIFDDIKFTIKCDGFTQIIARRSTSLWSLSVKHN